MSDPAQSNHTDEVTPPGRPVRSVPVVQRWPVGNCRRWAAVVAVSTTVALTGCGVAAADVALLPGPGEALVVGGTGNGTPSDEMMHTLFEQGIVSDPNPVGVTYPADLWPLRGDLTLDESVAVGVANLEAALAESSGPIVVVGISQGAVVVNYEKSALVAQAGVPRDLLFVTIGDPTNSDGGLLAKLPHLHIPVLDATIPKAPVETPYDTIEIVHEYDGYADFPDNPLNVLAVLNAVAGIAYEHPNKGGVDLSDPRNVITTSTNSLGGTTTHVLVPTDDLPLTRPLRTLGVPDRFVDVVDIPLRWVIDNGYSGERPHMVNARPTLRSFDEGRAGSAPVAAHEKAAANQHRSKRDIAKLRDSRGADTDTAQADVVRGARQSKADRTGAEDRDARDRRPAVGRFRHARADVTRQSAPGGEGVAHRSGR